MPEEYEPILSKLAEDESISKGEVIRRAIALYDHVKRHNPSVSRISLIGVGGTLLEEIVFDEVQKLYLVKKS